MNKPYTSEFANFMGQFLLAHPETIEEQLSGWRSFWDVKIHHETAHPGKEDLVPDDQYGFRWHLQKPH